MDFEKLVLKYLNNIYKIFAKGNFTEMTFRSEFQNFMTSINQDYNLLHEPQRIKGIGAPDYKAILKSNNVGYIETKAIFDNLEKRKESTQIIRYIENIDNLILTDYISFYHFDNGKQISMLSLVSENDFKNKEFLIHPSKLSKLENMITVFYKYKIPKIKKADELARMLARKAKLLDNVCTIILTDDQSKIDSKKSSLSDFSSLVNTLTIMDIDEISDAYAQTVVYGLFLSRYTHYRLTNKIIFGPNNVMDYIPTSVGLIKEILNGIILNVPNLYLDWFINDIIEILSNADMEAIINEYQSRMIDLFTFFYESFLDFYDPAKRKELGAYYTPFEVVKYIVQSIHSTLKVGFKITSGFADDNIKLLDPATGTGTFLYTAFLAALNEYKDAGKSGMIKGLIRNNILKHFYGFEYSFAPYIFSHLKLSFLLSRWGYQLTNDERIQVYLTNSLDKSKNIAALPYFREINQEQITANKIKEDNEIRVVLGNPPYSRSSTTNNWVDGKMDVFKDKTEKNQSQYNYEYIKFLRLADLKLSNVDKGIIGFIVNNAFLENRSFSKMRKYFIDNYNYIFVYNLYGGSRYGSKSEDDENVFDIQQDVTIIFLIKNPAIKTQVVHYDEIIGTKLFKLRELNELSKKNGFMGQKRKVINPVHPHYYFTPKDLEVNYENFISLSDIFISNNTGVTPGSKNILTGFTFEEIRNRMEKIFKDKDLTNILSKALKKSSGMRIKNKYKSISYSEKNIVKYHNYPFDIRYLYHEVEVLERKRKMFQDKIDGKIVKNYLVDQFSQDNLALCVLKATALKKFSEVFVTNILPDIKFAERTKRTQVFPLYIFDIEGKKKLNMNADILKSISDIIGKEVKPVDLFGYIYAILHSNKFRIKYNDNLIGDTPKIPIISDTEIYDKLVKIGSELINYHTLNCEISDVKFDIVGSNKVTSIKYIETEQKLYINKTQFFEPVSNEINNYIIGGYNVLNHYLEERKKRILSNIEIHQVLNIISILKKTIELCNKIDLIDVMNHVNLI